jgi:hypothetical protein
MPTAATVFARAVRNVELLAQMQGDSAAARDLASSIRLQIDKFWGLQRMSVSELQRLADKKVRKNTIAALVACGCGYGLTTQRTKNLPSAPPCRCLYGLLPLAAALRRLHPGHWQPAQRSM